MRFAIATSPHVHTGTSVARVMRRVLYALVPGIAAMVWVFGPGVLVQLALASLAALASEALVLALRRKPLGLFLGDCSALVTAWLLALALPALAPWWLVVLGTGFAIVVAKHVYGGLGYNPFNPAMIGYAVLLISFPREMSTWTAPRELLAHTPGFAASLDLIFAGGAVPELDAVSSATPLDTLRTRLDLGYPLGETLAAPIFGVVGGTGWELATLAFLVGGLWLCAKRTADWRIPAGMLGALAVIATVFWLLDPARHAAPWFHLASGAAVYGAFFIATDPVSASTTPRGRLIYGAGVGLLTYVIRIWGGYPDGVAFAVLLMNIAAPTIDHYTPPRVFGARSKDGHD